MIAVLILPVLMGQTSPTVPVRLVNSPAVQDGRKQPERKEAQERQALATQLVARFDKLTENELKSLIALGDDAFRPLFRLYVSACGAHDSAARGTDTYPLYSRAGEIADVLAKVASAKQATAILEALKAAKPEAICRPFLMTLLAQYGAPNDIVPLFLKELEDARKSKLEIYERTSPIAEVYIVGSSHPRAVDFMLKELRNPRSDLRQDAYWNLARTGGLEGLHAVLSERATRKPLRSLEARMQLGSMLPESAGKRTYSTLLEEKKDANGRTWGLVRCGILGNHGDLWITEKADGRWTRPVFLGVSTESPVRRLRGVTPPDWRIEGKKGSELLNGGWMSLVGNLEIKGDADGDGLTGLAEKRLGTDPKNRDSDRDGDIDGIDPWPNVASRPLSDAEAILEAVFEARCHFDDSESPGLFFGPASMKPFEMAGKRGPMMWTPTQIAPWAMELEKCYERGVVYVQFEGKLEPGRPQEQDWPTWNSDKTVATVTISTYYGGLEGTAYEASVKKFGDKWVVVQMRLAYIS